jgi:cell wall-associated NlpC family hydrolase
MTKAEKATQIMEQWAMDDSHGYDQAYRWGEYGDYDCSSAVITAWELAGVPVKTCGATTTWTMYPIFLAMGFADIIGSVDLTTGAGLQRGDILLNRKNHVAMYCGNGLEVEASINEFGGITGGHPGDQTGWEFLIQPYRNDYPWDHVLRYTRDDEVYHMDLEDVYLGCNGLHVLVCQKMLACCGLYGGLYDGAAGMKTHDAIVAFQQILVNEGKLAEVTGRCDAFTWKELVERHS